MTTSTTRTTRTTPSTAATPRLASMAWPDAERDAGPAKVLYAIRREALGQLSQALAREGVPALLVKGAALAETVYEKPWQRPMADIDLLVQRTQLSRVLAGLSQARFEVRTTPGRPLTELSLEIAARSPGPLGSTLVELHLSLDKVVPRRIDAPQLFERARSLAELPALLTPELEDHVLLVALHLAASDFHHLPGFVDLELLFTHGVDVDRLVARARSWRATTPLYIALRTLHALRPGLLPQRTLDQLAPHRTRLALLSHHFALGAYPVARRETALGLPWIARQTLLRDDTLHWLVGLGSYGAKRVVERTIGSRLSRAR